MVVPKTLLVVAALAFVGILAVAAIPASGIVPTSFDGSALARGVQVPAQRAGDALRYERAWTDDDGEVLRTDVLVTLTGPARAVDAFGIERETDGATVALRGEDGDADYGCHFLQGTPTLVRRDLLAGSHVVMYSGRWTQIPIADQTTRSASQTLNLTAGFDEPCAGRHTLGGATLRAGDELSLTEALGGAIVVRGSDEMRASAEATTWEGRDAVRFTFVREDERVVATWADGIPGVAQLEAAGIGTRTERGWYDASEGAPLTIRLVGVELGSGGPLPASSDTLPARNPSAIFGPLSPLIVDDSPFAPAYPYEEAITALRADPATCARDFLAREDAIVRRAEWDADARDYVAPAAPAIGGWAIDMIAGEDACSAFTIRLQPAPMLPFVTRNYDEEGPVPVVTRAEHHLELPAETADANTIAALSRLAGVEPGDARYVVWTLTTRHAEPALLVRASLVSPDPRGAPAPEETAAVDILATTGALDGILSTRTEVTTSPLPIGDVGKFPEISKSALGGLAGPAVGQGLAAAGVLGALVILLKFVLLPLYSRLRRATLLDNPVRARLYDAVRRDPGVHRAALIEFAGVGVGATTWHLRQLVDHRYLAQTREGGFIRYWAAGEVPPDVARREGILRAGSHRDVYELFRAEPALTLREAGSRLGMSAPSVHKAKRKLEQAGLLPAAPEALVAQA